MFRNSKLIISGAVFAILLVIVLAYWIIGNAASPSDIETRLTQLTSKKEKKISDLLSKAASSDVSPANEITIYQEVSQKNDTDEGNLVQKWAGQHGLQAEDMLGWRPSVKRTVSPEMAHKITQAIEGATVLLGYDKINSIKQTRFYKRTEYNSYFEGSETLLESMISYESYVTPNYTRREIHKGEYEEPLLIEVITDELVIQKKDGFDPATSINVFETPWYNYSNHPLMLYHELNPLIYESLDIRQLSAKEADTIGAKNATGHQIAILKTIHDTTRKNREFWCETWLDLENGHVLSNTMYDHDRIMVQTQDYVYKEVSDGILCPVARRIVFHNADGIRKTVIEEKVVDTEINIPIDKEGGLLFHH